MTPEEKRPSVSVVIPTYGHERHVEETLASVFAQTFTDYEVIVINDGSPDRTVDRLRPLIDAGRIRYYEQPNAGQSAARNTGLGLARGEFLALLDDDDLWPADKLAWQVVALRQNSDAVLCYGYAETFGLAKNYRLPAVMGPQGDVGTQLLHECPMLSPGQALIRTAAIRQLDGFDTAIRGTDDWDLWIRLGQIGHFVYVDHCALHYRQHAQNASQNSHKMFSAALQVLHKHLGRTPLNSEWRLWLRARRYIGRFTGNVALGQACDAARDGHPLTFVRRVLTALRFYPLFLGTKFFWFTLFQCLTRQIPARP